MVIPSLVESSGRILPWILLYIGPDVFLPIASAFAAIAGALLMFWNRVVGLVKKLWLTMSRRSE